MSNLQHVVLLKQVYLYLVKKNQSTKQLNLLIYNQLIQAKCTSNTFSDCRLQENMEVFRNKIKRSVQPDQSGNATCVVHKYWFACSSL